MLRIFIEPIHETYHYDIQHIIKLFAEKAEIHFNDEEDSPGSYDSHEALPPDHSSLSRIPGKRDRPEGRDSTPPGMEWKLSFSFRRGEEEVHVVARLTDPMGKEARGEAIRPLQDEKRAVGFALLRALTSYTGIVQPWGILVGVRPLKLYHKMLEKGMKKEDIHERLISEYGLLPEKVREMERIADRQLQVLPDLYHLSGEVSLYIGIPFCPTKCAYCTFPAYALQGKQGSVDAFLAALLEEIKVMGTWLTERKVPVTTLYVGGGTPTSLSADELDLLLSILAEVLPFREKLKELTVEAGRPDTITPEKIEVMKRWRVDRISINPQTFTQATLKAIGRHHTVEETLSAYRLARSMGMGNINMDLIIGLPGEGMAEYKKSLLHIEELMPDSLTVHTLSFKSASTMTQKREKYSVASAEEVSRMIRYTEEWTERHGYHPYYLYRQKNILGNQENVGYALPGKESLYNILIMEERQTIIGLGCGASSKMISPTSGRIFRFANPKEPKVYVEHYRDYLEKKIALLEEIYSQDEKESLTFPKK
ncbi:MAG: coproporphyrinogen dehydrogenase HemZ [Thermicanus sp.]|nr:coproporphyrinogen dehydrogenase HemZ [Thermicanus sp.]